MSLARRLEALEAASDQGGVCRHCGGQHAACVVELMAVARTEAAVCSCGCCAWVGELAEAAAR